jgi:hypothetical protein
VGGYSMVCYAIKVVIAWHVERQEWVKGELQECISKHKIFYKTVPKNLHPVVTKDGNITWEIRQ